MKKIILILTLIFTVFNFSVCAYNFPQPDWGALLAERKRMVTETDFELYTEGRVESAPYFGARLEPRGGAYIGMIAETSEAFQPLGSYLTYVEGMNQNDLYYPANQMIKNDNVVSMIGWTIYDINNINFDQIRNVLSTLNSYNKPMFIRFANEMNESALGNDPGKYIDIFRKVADIVHQYPNFAVVWSPIDIGALDRLFEYYYLGDEYVDWVGVSSYSIRYFLGNKNTSYNNSVYFMTGDYAWATNKLKPLMEFMAAKNINKPVMLSESGVATNNSYGDWCEDWAAPRLRNLLYSTVMKYPQIKMINYFNTYRASEKEKFDISSYPYAVDIFSNAAASGAYIREAGGSPDFVYQPADMGETLVEKNGIVKLYTLAYFANQPDITVNYTLDGTWYHSSKQIPYTCNMNISNLADGMHTMSISAGNTRKNYTFYKSGRFMRFGSEPDSEIMRREEENNSGISVRLNGKLIEFDQPPVIRNERTLVPLRAIFEALGAEVYWDEATQRVTSVAGKTTVALKIGSNMLYVNTREITMDVPAQLINGRTLVPVRAVSEAFGCSVDWDAEAKTVIITK
ncbi:MAG: stalk domain-containing protein [Candidatus Ornithomonoglobus sp.]